MSKRRAYVAYNRRSGIPYAASFDRNKIFDYAALLDLVVLDVDWLPEDEK